VAIHQQRWPFYPDVSSGQRTLNYEYMNWKLTGVTLESDKYTSIYILKTVHAVLLIPTAIAASLTFLMKNDVPRIKWLCVLRMQDCGLSPCTQIYAESEKDLWTSYVTYTNEASGGPQHNQSRKPQSTNSQFVVHLLPLKSAQYTLLSHMHRNKSSLSTALQISGTWHNTLEESKKLS